MPKKSKPEKLSLKADLFTKLIVEYDFDATRTAEAAGYSKKSAYSQGNRLLKDARVQAAIAETVENALGLKKGQLRYKVLKELEAIAFAEASNDISIVTEEVHIPILDQDGKETGEHDIKHVQKVLIKDTVDMQHTKAIKAITQDKDGIIKVEYYSKDSALKQLGQYGGLYKDKVEISGGLKNENSNINLDIPVNEMTENDAKAAFFKIINGDKE